MVLPDPNPAEERALCAAQASLADRGIMAGPHGYDLSTLAAAVYAHGGSYAIDLRAGSYRAEIRPQQPLRQEPRGSADGWTPVVALTFALLQALTRDSRPGQPGEAAVALSAEEHTP